MTSKDILALLKTRHEKDFFLTEVKDGPTWGTNFVRLDAWAMNRSWANPCTYGYEIKASRSDFLRDNKWQQYLAYCNQFFFVAPKGIIEPGELQDGVGLLVAAGSRLLTKKKAAYRQIEIPECFYRYILMNRVAVSKHARNERDTLAYWQNWLKDREAGKLTGQKVAKRLQEEYWRMEGECMRLREKIESLESFKESLISAGINPDNLNRWNHDKRIAVAQGMGDNLQSLKASLEGTNDQIKRLITWLDECEKERAEILAKAAKR